MAKSLDIIERGINIKMDTSEKLKIYSNMLKKQLETKGFKLLSETTKHDAGILLNFAKNNHEISQNIIKTNCKYLLDIKNDTFSLYLLA